MDVTEMLGSDAVSCPLCPLCFLKNTGPSVQSSRRSSPFPNAHCFPPAAAVETGCPKAATLLCWQPTKPCPNWKNTGFGGSHQVCNSLFQDGIQRPNWGYGDSATRDLCFLPPPISHRRSTPLPCIHSGLLPTVDLGPICACVHQKNKEVLRITGGKKGLPRWWSG